MEYIILTFKLIGVCLLGVFGIALACYVIVFMFWLLNTILKPLDRWTDKVLD